MRAPARVAVESGPAPPRRYRRRVACGYSALISVISPVSDAFASPKSMLVFGS